MNQFSGKDELEAKLKENSLYCSLIYQRRMVVAQRSEMNLGRIFFVCVLKCVLLIFLEIKGLLFFTRVMAHLILSVGMVCCNPRVL